CCKYWNITISANFATSHNKPAWESSSNEKLCRYQWLAFRGAGARMWDRIPILSTRRDRIGILSHELPPRDAIHGFGLLLFLRLHIARLQAELQNCVRIVGARNQLRLPRRAHEKLGELARKAIHELGVLRSLGKVLELVGV